ncbi:Gamma-glutamyltranspeptidase precursor [Dermatophilus congolensis]|uniref:Gamma-glutamyltranspeptidase n=1 Tax=Dermatophilus congolensis TaxID=1863 RepID=A0AA46GZM5_9MICO|nr:gamma-glutamyltransferase [Dermatophilus congolensis]STD04940.1 Gamma-glutamyltranspeptidase precursor [Dermatophilus congolensis]
MTGVAIAAPSPAAVEAATAVSADGGNAVDAAIAAVCVATVTEFGITGPMGGGFINVWQPGHEPVVIDANAEMPGRGITADRLGRGLRRFDFDYFGPVTLYGGHASVGTPGLFAGLGHAHRRWARLPWHALINNAAVVARDGFPLGASAAFWLDRAADHLFGWNAECVDYIRQAPDRSRPVAGQIMRSSNLARSFETIARDGVSTLYTGEIAHVITEDMAANEGLISWEDLAAYRVIERPALRARIGEYDVATNPPPSIGGPVLAACLRTLEHRRTGDRISAADIIETLRLVLGYRWSVIDLAEDLTEAGSELIRLLDEAGPQRLSLLSSSPDTVHVSVVDADGMACSITTSCGYCSGYIAPGTGLMFNNALGEAELNRRGFHSMPPGTRIASNMAPTTAHTDAGAVLAVGSPGADRITTALFQVIAALAFDKASLQEAIVHPRIHLAAEAEGVVLRLEAHPAAEKAAQASGLPVILSEGLTMYFGGVGAAARDCDGILHAVGDPRRQAATAVHL